MPLFGVAGVDARRAAPPDRRRVRRGLAGNSQLDPSHPWRAWIGAQCAGGSLANASSTPATSTFLSIHLASSGHQLRDHARRLDAGQALVETLIAVCESLMVETQKLQNGGVEVADVDGILDDVI
jgi:hypothetical protein